ncbi:MULTISPECIES: type II toxin-antitoxin system Phd/YefM family antitoxin [Pasteurellaceae]|uniref:Antitoxin n=1 Tax=Pasteurella atlantica TaxID=2827233 RepID=A0AAW8CQA5_9PAST|nr:type II toxin-antitoxin system Phd/YefM family antitoxin [Pasteurella atlantica]MBR0574541.1 type II toxin-antitoxin system Phd/YefM family antitoxin [Pasteurella atlantica]MDP8040423.1 type II toxin-antitoxin system Phd/YefM family antitoxin [Pasteurella atlantica]MDP8042589.1 type II toxin-antitoxin system Phd/YefM family antitoxin [Pasteurella atlantica]MDP8044691.1 type II toxin-antitoxin system Phd/YefM family antitoxin [Pasteurella atlantica]MDP8046727.1 type II toxin-antitoxin system
MFITSREFNQNLAKAKQLAANEPVIITNRGNPEFVLMRYDDYQVQKQEKKQSAYEWLCSQDDYDVADIELDIPPRSKTNRPIPFVDYGLEDE